MLSTGFLNRKYEFYMITIQYQVNYWLFLRTDHFLYSIQVFDRIFNKKE